MTKITRRQEHAAVAAEMLDFNQRGARDVNPITPLDDHRSAVGELVESQAGQLDRILDSVQVDVRELDAPWIDAHKLKGRAGHGRGRTGPSGHAPDECRLAGAQLAGKE